MRIFAALVVCGLLLAPTASWALEPDDPALVGVWQFDEGSGDLVTDLINGNDGDILSLGVEFEWEPGKFGNALANVDGGGSIDVPNSSSLESIAEAITMAGWFRIDGDSDTGIRNNGGFLLEDQSDSEPVPDGWSFRIWTTDGLSPGIYGQTELAQGEWYHVAGTYDGELMELYINGEPESALGLLDSGGAEIDPDWSGDIDLGSILQLKYGAESFVGAMDEMVILSRALAQDEIKQLMNGWDNLGAGATALQAGDADMNLEFNQLDLVKVQVAAKYLTGNPATWGEGDWNGAPGGEVGSPPAGDNLFNQLDIIAALTGGKYLTGPYAAISTGGTEGDGQTSVGYNASTGEVWVDAPAGADLTSINIDSAASIFTGDAAQNLGGSFDNDADNNIFKATFGGTFATLSFGTVAQAGLSEEFVANDLTVVGSLAGGGDLGAVDLIYVPEPASILLLVMGLAAIGLLSRRGRRS